MTRKKILIVDDQEDFVVTMKYFFEKNGYDVLAALDSAAALEKAKEAPDIVLLDIGMPNVSGFEILQELRNCPATAEIPVIMLTAASDVQFIHEALSLRATDYIIKTESFDRILSTVKKYLAIYEREPSAERAARGTRRSGIDVLPDVAWGKHICALYGSRDDLVSLVLPFLGAGLSHNELCVWTLSEGLLAEDARAFLSVVTRHVDVYLKTGQLKILGPEAVYGRNAAFDPRNALDFWDKSERSALAAGFDGIRVTGTLTQESGTTWRAICDYERQVNDLIATRKIIALCTYSFNRISMPEMISVGTYHAVICARQADKAVSFVPGSRDAFLKHFDRDGKNVVV